MNKIQRKTKKMAERMIGQWVISGQAWFSPIYKVTGYSRHGMNIHATKFGNGFSVTLKTRKYQLASENEVAEAVARRIQGNDPYFDGITGSCDRQPPLAQ